MPQVQVQGVPIHYEQSGAPAGRAVVLVHGFPLDGRIYADQLAALGRWSSSAGALRVIVPDLPGFGRSPRLPDSGFTMTGVADLLHAFLARIDALPCVLGGLSMGGYIALPFAQRHRADLRGLLLIDTRSEADTPDARTNRDRLLAAARERGPGAIVEAMFPKMLAPRTPAAQPEVAARLRQIMESQPLETMTAALAGIRDRTDFTRRLATLGVPAHVIVGEHDAITPPDGARQMAGQLNAGLTLIPDAGHLPTMESPTAVNQAIQQAIAAW